jgi:hypothetical protein
MVLAAAVIPFTAYSADEALKDKKDTPAAEEKKEEGKEKKEESKASIEGSLETTGNFYTSHNEYYNRTRTEYRVYENVAFDAAFNENWFFRFNSRAGYQTQKGGSAGNWLFNFFYGYLDFESDRFAMQLGRIMDFENLVYLYFDGINLEAKFPIGEHRLTLDLYGGFVVKDDYVEEYRNPWMLRTFNSTDYRNLFIRQRKGDYIAGCKIELLANTAGLFGAEYQLIFNGGRVAEQYVSLNFETMFSRKFKLTGYGTLDLVAKLPSNTLVAMQINPSDLLSIVFEHEYYRPVFIKDSYFWVYFKPYGNQQASARLIFFISKLLTFDMKYGAILYDSATEVGNEISLNLEHRDIGKFGLRINAEMIIGPEGNLITAQATLKRKIFVFDLLAGGGVQFYSEKIITKGMSPGYFAMLGVDINIIKSLVLSATGDFSSNEDFRYNMRGNLSLKYLF